MEIQKLGDRKWTDVTGESVVVKMRKEIYITMFEICKEHAELAKQAAGADINKNMNPEIKESMISILFAYTCLEAYINTIGKDKLGVDWPRYEDNSTEGKWLGVSKALATKKSGHISDVFNHGKEPFKSFLELEKIREEYLVHRKAEFNDVVPTKYGNTEGIINTLNCDKADWACKTVKDMVSKLNESIDAPPSVGWLT
jgi:hypothetical protein